MMKSITSKHSKILRQPLLIDRIILELSFLPNFFGYSWDILPVTELLESTWNVNKMEQNQEMNKLNLQLKQLQIPSSMIDYSSIRNKSVLVSPTEEQFELLRKYLKDRMDESRVETIYEIGIGDDACDIGLDLEEYAASLATLQSLATTLNADCVELRLRRGDKGKKVGQYLIRQKVDESDFMEIRVAVVGNVDAGKSTLLGVLTHGELDNGRGHARQRLFRHKHEMESGRTSSVGNDILVRLRCSNFQPHFIILFL